MIYFTVGVVCGMSFEALMTETDPDDETTNLERFFWVFFWPFFIILFIYGMMKK